MSRVTTALVLLLIAALTGVVGYVIYLRHGDTISAQVNMRSLPDNTVMPNQFADPRPLVPLVIVGEQNVPTVRDITPEEVDKSISIDADMSSYVVDGVKRGYIPEGSGVIREGFEAALPAASGDHPSEPRLKAAFEVPKTGVAVPKLGLPTESGKPASSRAGFTPPRNAVKIENFEGKSIVPLNGIDYITLDRDMLEDALSQDNHIVADF